MKYSCFSKDITPDWVGLVDCIERRGSLKRVHNIELFLDDEVKTTICDHYHLADDIDIENMETELIFFENYKQHNGKDLTEEIKAIKKRGYENAAMKERKEAAEYLKKGNPALANIKNMLANEYEKILDSYKISQRKIPCLETSGKGTIDRYRFR